MGLADRPQLPQGKIAHPYGQAAGHPDHDQKARHLNQQPQRPARHQAPRIHVASDTPCHKIGEIRHD